MRELRIVAHLLGELAHVIVHRLAQVLRQLLDLLVGRAAVERLLQRVLRRAQRLVDIGDIAVLDGDGERPHAGDHRAQRIVGVRGLELAGDRAQAEILPGLRHEQFGRDQERIERGEHVAIAVGVERQDAALLDQRPRQGLGEQPLRQPRLERLALALIAGLVLCGQRQRDVGAGIGIFAQILHGLAYAVAGAGVRQRQREFRRLEQRPRLLGACSGVDWASVLRATTWACASVTP